MTTYVILWAALGVATLALAVYRKWGVAMREDAYVHLSQGEERLIPQQEAIFHKLAVIDHWGISLTIVTAVLGLVLAGIYLYHAAVGH